MFQIFGPPGRMSSASALETPVEPPTLSSPSVSPEPEPGSGEKTETPSPAEPVKEEIAEPEPKPEPKAEPKPEVKPEPKKEAKKEETKKSSPIEPSKAPAKVENDQKNDKNLKTPSKKEKKAPKATPEKPKKEIPAAKLEAVPEKLAPVIVSEAKKILEKPAKKPSKKRRKAAPKLETEMPPEWNWFSEPLKVDVKENGSWNLTTAYETSVKWTQTPLETPTETPIEEAVAVEETAPNFGAIQPVTDSRQEGLFVRVLAKVQARKARIIQEAEKKGLILPSQGGESKKVPSSLLRIKDAINMLMDRQNTVPITFSPIVPEPKDNHLEVPQTPPVVGFQEATPEKPEFNQQTLEHPADQTGSSRFSMNLLDKEVWPTIQNNT